MIKKKRYEYWEESDTAYDTKIKYGQYFRIIDKKECVDLLNNQEETIQELLQYKYLVKALEEINKTYIEELISDWTDGAYSDKEEQLQLGKYHSENGLSWEDKE